MARDMERTMNNPMPSDLGTLLRSAATRYSNHPAILLPQRTVDFQTLEHITNSVACRLQKMGIRKGDRVGIYCPNSDAFVEVYLSIVKAGGVVVPLNLLLNPKEVAFILNDAEARFLFYADIFHEAVRAIRKEVPSLQTAICIGEHTPPDDESFHTWINSPADEFHSPSFNPREDLAAILYTSGTTGRPKGAMLTHANIAINVRSVHEALQFQPGVDRVIAVLPMFHAFAATAAMLAPLLAGCAVVPIPRFNPEHVARSIAEHQATLFMGVPSMYTMLLRLSDEFVPMVSSLRFCISGGAALPVEVMTRFEKRFGKCIYEGDGPTECSPVTCVNPIGGRRKPGSVGKPVPYVEMKIMDDHGRELTRGQTGEICVRGPNVMKGYWRLPDDTAKAFFGEWFRTGDVGYEDEDGYFYIVDRKKDMIIVNGINVYPRIIEELLYRHHAIREAAVVGEPHPLHGEIPVAFIALQTDAKVTAAELREYCLKNLGRHEVPRKFIFLNELPKNATGKIMKRALRKEGEIERGIEHPENPP